MKSEQSGWNDKVLAHRTVTVSITCVTVSYAVSCYVTRPLVSGQ